MSSEARDTQDGPQSGEPEYEVVPRPSRRKATPRKKKTTRKNDATQANTNSPSENVNNATEANTNPTPDKVPKVPQPMVIDMEKIIATEAFQKALDQQVERRMQHLRIDDQQEKNVVTQQALDKQYFPRTNPRKVEDHQRLTGWKGWKTWAEMIRNDLSQLNLDWFLDSFEPPELPVSPMTMKQMNSLALNVIKDACSKSVAATITSTSAYEAYQHLRGLYQNTPMLTDFDMYRRFVRVQMKPGFDPSRFLGDFERIIREFADEGIIFPDRFLKCVFFSKLHGIDDKDSPYFSYFHTLSALPTKMQTWELIKSRFLSIVPPKSDKPKHSKNKEEKLSTNQQSGTPSNASSSTQSNSNDQMPNRKRGAPGSSNQTHAKKLKVEPGTESKPKIVSPYSEEQREKLRNATAEQKREWRCATCGLYFHKADACPHGSPVCYRCFKKGHLGKNCRNPVFLPKPKN